MRSQCVTLGKGLSRARDNLLHFRVSLPPDRRSLGVAERREHGVYSSDRRRRGALLHAERLPGPPRLPGDRVHDGKTGLAKALGGNYSIMLLDVMLPGLDGFEVLRRLRAAASPMNVLLLTARGEDVDRIVGLEIGADDYLPKPFNPRELLARIRAILRRSGKRRGARPSREIF